MSTFLIFTFWNVRVKQHSLFGILVIHLVEKYIAYSKNGYQRPWLLRIHHFENKRQNLPSLESVIFENSQSFAYVYIYLPYRQFLEITSNRVLTFTWRALWFVRIKNSLKTQKYQNHLYDILGCLFNQFLHELNDIELFLQHTRLKN